ncbi:MAG: CDP-diacylglycerol--serine O-phosphatidyltransferase [Alphaproteobacteria bacterium]|nr:CDP-diacylglycerol--serine O-phosphatidyltransferase [Alphaproteobacteria bacterium]
MDKEARKKCLKELPFNKIVPNIVTLFALSAGMASIRYTVLERWEAAVIAIIIAGILDALDGRVARLLQGTSKFGAELDSLSDFLSFGVAPSILMYFWAMNGTFGFGWAIALLYCICCCLRLARFNTMLEDEKTAPEWENFFVGTPAPCAAALAMFPAVMYFFFEWEYLRHPILVGTFLVVVAVLMISPIPTYSAKHIKVRLPYVLPLLVAVAFWGGFLVIKPWPTLGITCMLYLCSIPLSIHKFTKIKAELKVADGKKNSKSK